MIPKQAYELIQALDLEPIKFKLMHAESGEGWTRRKANAVEFEYRRFLFMIKMYPDEQISPVEDVDTFWHYHILDTMKYAADCDAIFGHFVHHYPYAGMGGHDDELAMLDNADHSRDLYQRTFASPYPGAQPNGHVQSAADAVADGMATAVVPGATADRGSADKAAYCVVAEKPAYCVRSNAPAQAARPDRATNNAAYCVIAAKPAYCVETAKPAYCVETAKPAYCVETAKPAYCVETAKPADGAVSSKPAYCVFTGSKPTERPAAGRRAHRGKRVAERQLQAA
jgi:hypothetical protein